jgi:ABC-type multidrug transport system fused ATPase/permease subunit
VTIAHRLETIADYDKILVLDQVNINNFNKKGAVVEFDHPFKLLVKN